MNVNSVLEVPKSCPFSDPIAVPVLICSSDPALSLDLSIAPEMYVNESCTLSILPLPFHSDSIVHTVLEQSSKSQTNIGTWTGINLAEFRFEEKSYTSSGVKKAPKAETK